MRWNIVRLDRVTSTQDVARDSVLRGADPGLLIVAKTQTEGRGRHGNDWHSPLGGLYTTAVLRPIGRVSLLPILAGVAVAEAIEVSTGIEPELKWPNDVLICGRKVGGVMAESGWLGGEAKFILLGIGVNLNNPPPEEIQNATSLCHELGRMIDIEEFLKTLIERLDHHLHFLEADTAGIIQSWKRLSQTLCEEVEVKDKSRRPVRGVAVDIDQDGALVVMTESGRRRVISGILDRRYS